VGGEGSDRGTLPRMELTSDPYDYSTETLLRSTARENAELRELLTAVAGELAARLRARGAGRALPGAGDAAAAVTVGGGIVTVGGT